MNSLTANNRLSQQPVGTGYPGREGRDHYQ